jgi:tripartite-type tricarboxylate transporter receptor subunit TctC
MLPGKEEPIMTSRLHAAVAAAVLAFAYPIGGAAQGYPSKPVRIIVPFPAGGNADILARILGQKMADGLGQSVVVENRAGAAGIIGAQTAAKSAPDGYTLFMGTTGTQTTNPAVYTKLPYDPLKDFAPVSNFAGSPYILVVHPSLPARTVAELVALARARPGALHYASFGAGSSAHLTGEMLASVANVKLVHVAYKGGPPALADLVGGHVEMMFNLLPGVLPHVRDRKLRGIAVAAPKRTPALPDMPTFAESGISDFFSDSWYGIVVPAGTPQAVIHRLAEEIRRVAALPDVRRNLDAQGAEAMANSPEEFADQIKKDLARWSKVAREANVRID